MVRSFYFKGKGIVRKLKGIFVSFPFWLITFLGNFFIFIVSGLFYWVEGPPAVQFGGTKYVHSFIDAVWWGFATVTSVGYGDIVPHTLLGRLLGIFLMIFGAGLFASYTGLFAKAFLEYEIEPMEEEIKELEKEIHVVSDFMKGQGHHTEQQPPSRAGKTLSCNDLEQQLDEIIEQLNSAKKKLQQFNSKR